MTMIRTLISLLLLLSLTSAVEVSAQSYPASSYQLSGNTLVRWVGSEADIDFTKDPALQGVNYIENNAFPATVKRVNFSYRFTDDSRRSSFQYLFVAPEQVEHLSWEDDREAAERTTDEERYYLRVDHLGFEFFTHLKTLRIPRQMKLRESIDYGGVVLSDFNGLYPHLERIDVSSQHPLYRSDDGVLFDKQRRVLIKYPATRTGHYEIPSQVEELSPYAFADGQLNTVSIPAAVRRIPFGCFERSKQLQTVLLPSALLTIADKAFGRCAALKTIPLPQQLDSIGRGAFSQCTSLPATIKLPASLSFISGAAYRQSSVTDYAIGHQSAYYSAREGVLYSKDGSTLVAYPVGRKEKEVVVADHVRRIGELAFYMHPHLNRVILPEGLEEVGRNAFALCDGLEEVDIPSSVHTMGYDAFFYNRLRRITLQGEFTAYYYDGTITPRAGESLFGKRDKALPRRVVAYAEMPFSLEWNQEDVKIDTLYVPTEAMELYRIAPGWRHFGTFRSTDELPKPKVLPFQLSSDKQTLVRWKDDTTQEVDFTAYPELKAVRHIAQGAFARHPALRRIVAPAVETIVSAGQEEAGAFEQCIRLAEVDLPQLREVGNAAFYECTALRTLALPQLETIAMSAFAYCASLERIDLPRVATIEGYAFNSCSKLTALQLPASLSRVGDYAFSSCTALQKVQCEATTPPTLGIGVWSGVATEGVDLLVPATARAAYRAAAQWKDFRFPTEEPSSISHLPSHSPAAQPIFDLSGRRISAAAARHRLHIRATGQKRLGGE